MKPGRKRKSKTPVKDSSSEDDEAEEDNGVVLSQRRTRLRAELTSLHKEMEVAQYASVKGGNLRRKVPRDQAVARAIKRRILEAQDDEMFAEEEEEPKQTKRLRGAKAAQADEVIKGSLVFGVPLDTQDPEEEESESEESEEEEGYNDDSDDENLDDADKNMDDVDIEDEEVVGDIDDEEFEDEEFVDDDDEDEPEEEEPEEEDDEEDEEEEDDEEEEEEDAGEEDENDAESDTPQSQKKSKRKLSMKKTPKRRMFRLRNFKSFKMAQRHGEALGAHARGLPKLAIYKLKQVANDAPSAPQVYSSLGMVYEDMLKDSQRKREAKQNGKDTENFEEREDLLGGEEDVYIDDEITPDPELSEQLKLAKKAYGSFHVAALLCKKDYTLWVRAADSASEIAHLHTDVMLLPSITDEVREYHRSEKVRWLSESKNDYQTADNLKPPGLDVPAKLAALLIELGNMSEALTLLTDLKNRSPNNARSPFESSCKAWLLYADLMLRIGFESTEWNRGNHSNNNYMFRRWLRKFSKTFDWQERRLQALAKALEAAAGSKSCGVLMQWMEDKAKALHDAQAAEDAESGGEKDLSKNEEADSNDNSGEGSMKDNADPSVSNSSTGGLSSKDLEKEKELLLERNRAELEDFDKTTREIKMNNDKAALEARDDARESLFAKQKAAVVELVGSLYCRQGQNEMSSPDKVPKAKRNERASLSAIQSPLPVSASCRTVCRIASELMRHMLTMGLHTGGRLVGEATSLYLKERGSMIEKSIESKRRFREAQRQPTSIFALQHETYDAVDKGSDEEESGNSDVPFSDEDELADDEASGVIDSLRRGALPPELRFFYGICLAGEGGKQFLATKCLEAINDLEQEPLQWLREKFIDASVVVDSSWLNFQCNATDPLRRTSAYSLIADFLKADTLKIPADKLADLFSSHVNYLIESGMVNDAFNSHGRHALAVQRRNQVLDVLVASARCQALLLEKIVNRGGEEEDCKGKIIHLFDSLTQYLTVRWKVEDNGAISSSCMEILSVMATSLNLLHSCRGASTKSFAHGLLAKMIKPVSLLCGTDGFELGNEMQQSLDDLKEFPFPGTWLSDDLRMLSLRTYNCAVATNCSHFSGWENEEFTDGLLRDTDAPYYFGVSLNGGHTAGFLATSLADVLAEQWDILQKVLPGSCSFDFSAQMTALRSTPTYIEMKERHENASRSQSIHLYAEEDSLSILLSFSHYNLLMAKDTDDISLKPKLALTALSIILPLSQFSLNQILWMSSVGRAAASRPGLKAWRPLQSRKRDSGNLTRPLRRKPSSNAHGGGELHQWFAGENNEVSLSNVVQVPPAALLDAWKSVECNRDARDSTESVELMQELDISLRKLRSCYSAEAAETTSLKVAVKLIRLAVAPRCENPFLCLQQAALFASQGKKGGGSADLFKVPLSRKDSCSPLDALAILGRADCLQALYFYEEAAFLCSYVASICASRRSHQRADLDWNSRWKVIALVTYNQSVLLRSAANSVVREHGKKEDTTATWETEVIEELKRARADGLSWLANLEGDGNYTADLVGRVHMNRYAMIDGVPPMPEGKSPTTNGDIIATLDHNSSTEYYEGGFEMYSEPDVDIYNEPDVEEVEMYAV
jgi:hypothetical protein